MPSMECPECGTTLVQVKRTSAVSVGGFMSAIFFLIGIVAILFNAIAGLICLVIAAILAATRSKNDWLTCPKCHKDIVKL